MLDTATTRVEIGQSWEAISNDIDIVEAYDLARHNEQVRNQMFRFARILISYFKI